MASKKFDLYSDTSLQPICACVSLVIHHPFQLLNQMTVPKHLVCKIWVQKPPQSPTF